MASTYNGQERRRGTDLRRAKNLAAAATCYALVGLLWWMVTHKAETAQFLIECLPL